MEKKATYTVISPKHHPNTINNNHSSNHHIIKREWVILLVACLSIIAVVVACATAAVVTQQSTRVNHLEERVMEMESHLEDLLRLTIANYEYDNFDYNDDDIGSGLDDGGAMNGELLDYEYYEDGDEDSITVRGVLRRRKRQANNNIDDTTLSDASPVPIYDQAYGVNLETSRAPKGLRLYDSLLDPDEEETEGDEENNNTPEALEDPIKPHHRISNLWVPKKRRPRLPTSSGPPTLSARTLVRQIDSTNGLEENEVAETLYSHPSPLNTRRRSHLNELRSRTKNLHGARRGLKRRQKERDVTNPTPSSVVFRPSLVKATSRHDGYTSPNSAADSLLEAPKVVRQDVGGRRGRGRGRELVSYVRGPSTGTSSFYGKKRRKPRNKQHRRRRRVRPALTVAHFGATPSNSSARQVLPTSGYHEEWTPAPWMSKLGLNGKYNMERGTATVRDSGLYYLYAQVLYESGRAHGGFQIIVDGIPILECQAPALRPAPSCFVGGISYLPRNAKIQVRDLDNYLRTVKQAHNTFFGLIKLMDAPATAEELLLG